MNRRGFMARLGVTLATLPFVGSQLPKSLSNTTSASSRSIHSPENTTVAGTIEILKPTIGEIAHKFDVPMNSDAYTLMCNTIRPDEEPHWISDHPYLFLYDRYPIITAKTHHGFTIQVETELPVGTRIEFMAVE